MYRLYSVPYSGGSSKFLISFVHFSFRSSKLFQLYHFKASSNHCKASPRVLFNFPFRLIVLLLPEFFMEALHGGSSSIPFIVHLFFKISLEAKICQAILKIKHGVQHMPCFEEFKHSSSCISKCNSFYLIFSGGVISFLTISIHVSRFTCCQERGILNPSISSLDLSWYRFHLKPSLRNVAIVVLTNDPSSPIILLVEEIFHLVSVINYIICFHSGRISPQF